jgi:hypothetical protein
LIWGDKKGENMDYGMIGKRERAKRYAEERNRFTFNKFEVTFHGDNNDHHVTFENGVFTCDCEFFKMHQRCAHTMALEIKLQGMLPEQNLDHLAGDATTDAPPPSQKKTQKRN